MFRKIGKYRSYGDNLRLAGFLTTTAGIVNVASLMAFYVLTTNVTGHMAIFSEEITKGHWHQVQVVFLWMLMFILGAFTSTVLTLVLGKRNPKRFNYLTVLIEIILLTGVGLYGFAYYEGKLQEAEILSAILLFSMGLQNALVTYISSAVVRTTHLTGLFTDLGIELASLLKKDIDKGPLKRKLILRFTILFYYFLGGIIGGYIFLKYSFTVFFAAAAIMTVALAYDWVKLRVIRLQKKSQQNKRNTISWQAEQPQNGKSKVSVTR